MSSSESHSSSEEEGRELPTDDEIEDFYCRGRTEANKDARRPVRYNCGCWAGSSIIVYPRYLRSRYTQDPPNSTYYLEYPCFEHRSKFIYPKDKSDKAEKFLDVVMHGSS